MTRTRPWVAILSAVECSRRDLDLALTGLPQFATVAGLLAYVCFIAALVWIVRAVVWRTRR